MEMQQSDRVTEWSSSGDQIGLEEPMWQLGLGDEGELYPERPDEADCIYYLKTGVCGYGSRCRFNHPRDRGGSCDLMWVVGGLRSGGGGYPERIGQPVCQVLCLIFEFLNFEMMILVLCVKKKVNHDCDSGYAAQEIVFFSVFQLECQFDKLF
ncbi:putative transcription factor C3H family [Helianthus annuus]|nr:putative transcription factor C3H family [Helianthus annuus]